MRPSRSRGDAIRARLADDRGSASVELLAAGLLLLVPAVYLVLVISAVHSAALATEGAARQGARVFVRAPDAETARARLAESVAVTLDDYGLEHDQADVRVICAPDPRDCLRRDGRVTVTVGLGVPLPLVPAALSVDAPASVPIDASATQPVSRFRADG